MTKRIYNKINRILLGVLPKKKWIVFESVPDLSDNTKAVFDEMVRRKLNQKYLFIWVVSDKKKDFPKYENTIYIDQNDSREFNKYLKRAKIFILCNQFLGYNFKGQKSFYLTHGTAIKNVGEYFIPPTIDYNLVASKESITLYEIVDKYLPILLTDINKTKELVSKIRKYNLPTSILLKTLVEVSDNNRNKYE